MSSIKKISGVVLVGAVLALAGCGNDDSTTTGGLSGGTTGGGTTGGGTTGGGNGTGTGGTTGSSTTTAHTIVLTYPFLDRIQNMGGGVYRSKAMAIVTDSEGNAVPDGSVVSFNIIDSVIARGSISTAAGDSITGAVLTDADPTKANGTTATNFVDSYVERNAAHRFITSGDHVFLVNKADAEDKNRVISSAAGSIGATTLTMTSSYSKAYPNTVYSSGMTEYVVGASLLGAEISGLDTDGNLRTGSAVTKEGIATFYVTYPANSSTINTGCGSVSSVDTRALPLGSADVYLVASAANSVTTVDDRFCFGSIAGWTLTPDFNTISGTATIKMLLEDGGDKVNLPFVGVATSVVITKNTGGITVTLDNQGSGPGVYVTDQYGWFSSTITVAGGASGDTATITYRTGDATTAVSLKIP